MAKFDSKSFNEKAFKYSVDRVPNLKMNEIKKSKALTGNPEIKAVFSNQNGTAYARIAMRGLIDGDAVNYDGQTDIEATRTKTYERGVVVVGRAKAWTESDFSYDVTGGVDFMQNVANQIAEYKDGLDQDTILATLKGVFSMKKGDKNKEFVSKHTTEIDTPMTATTLNSATNKACGSNKKKFTMIFMHSDVATNLENLRLIEHLKYTDANGVTRELDLGTWNGKLVVIDDDMPTEEVPAKKAKGIEGTDDYVPAQDGYTKYTSYALGTGSIDYEDVGVKHPYSMSRDEKTNGGEDTLYIRQRKVFAPFGISYEKKQQESLSPTDKELANGDNWALVSSGEEDESKCSYINHKSIPILQIISRG